MKTILITIPNGAVSQGFLRTEFLPTLMQGGVRAVLVVPPYREAYYKKEFAGRANIVVEPAPMHRYKTFEDLANRFLRQSIPSITIRNRQWHALYSHTGLKRFLTFAGTRALWVMGHSCIWRQFLRFIYSLTPTAFMPLVDAYKPDLVFVTTSYDRMDLGLMKAARRRGVRTVGMTKSWDSITSKCFFALWPDHLLVQNELLKNEAAQYGDMGRERITVCGMPQFDFYYREDMREARESTLASVGLPAHARYVLFGGEGLDLFPGECEVLDLVARGMQDDPELSALTLVYRAHPNYEWCQGAGNHPNVVVDFPGKRIEDTAGGWEFEQDDVRHLVSTILHAEVLVTMASTLVLEAALFDRPAVGIATDGAVQKPFYLSAERYYHTDHYRAVVKTGALAVARTPQAILDAIKKYLRNPAQDKEGRERLAKEQTVFLDGKSAARVADILLKEVGLSV